MATGSNFYGILGFPVFSNCQKVVEKSKTDNVFGGSFKHLLNSLKIHFGAARTIDSPRKQFFFVFNCWQKSCLILARFRIFCRFFGLPVVRHYQKGAKTQKWSWAFLPGPIRGTRANMSHFFDFWVLGCVEVFKIHF